LERDGERVRLITKGGYDWTKRFPWIVEAALMNRNKQFVLDGRPDFDALHSNKKTTSSSYVLSTCCRRAARIFEP
jgi:bifunctional non-homologous end joining protein LigD